MMRSLYSGVAGLKTHQTRMDVIGNNIANVNTTAYKSQSMTFSDLLYQTTQAASGANPTTGKGGINARQIGLGSKTGAIATAITRQGSAQSTNNPFDIMITGEEFFIVSNGSENFFTRDGSFTVDGNGNLVMSSTGYTVMGWQSNADGDIVVDTVSALQIMSDQNLTYPPEATTKGYVSGILDKNDTNVNATSGRIVTLTFYDDLGYQYTAKFSIHGTDYEGQYDVVLDDILDETGTSLVEAYNVTSIKDIATFGTSKTETTEALYNVVEGVTIVEDASTTPSTFTYYSTLAIGDVLSGYDDNVMVKLASAGANPAKISGLVTGDSIVKGDSVVVAGAVSLKQETLEGDPYNLTLGTYNYVNTGSGIVELFDSGMEEVIIGGETKTLQTYSNKDGSKKYYVNPTDDKLYENTSFTAGTGLDLVSEPAYYYNQDDPYGIAKAGERVGATGDEKAEWQQALKSLKVTGISAVTVNSDGTVDLDFEQTFIANQDATVLDPLNFKTEITALEAFGLEDSSSATQSTTYVLDYVSPDGKEAQVVKSVTTTGNRLVFDTSTGDFKYIQSVDNDNVTLNFKPSAISLKGQSIDLGKFQDIDVDFSLTTMFNNGGTSTIGATNGTVDGYNTGRKLGEMTGVEIGNDGRIVASYDNGQTKYLGQIAVASFANASGLSKAGDNLYSATQNSGAFDGVGIDISANGDYMTSGVLEMSNVDLAAEFTEMITTQRGFQANSRIITTSDSMLEELVNLKR